ncbi:MAG: S-layer homology domain-containing protein [Thermoleophilia bacterium]|nr:S-layer homology domain-containing protein [Thermoleophilia bacterium]
MISFYQELFKAQGQAMATERVGVMGTESRVGLVRRTGRKELAQRFRSQHMGLALRPSGHILATAATTIVLFLLVFSSWTGTTVAGGPDFVDVQGDEWFASALTELSARGIVQGFPDQSFGPERFVTKGQLAIFLARVLRLDSSQVDPVSCLVNAQVVDETEVSDFRPFQLASRQEAAAWLMRAVLRLAGEDRTGWPLDEMSLSSDEGSSSLIGGQEQDELDAWLGAFLDRNMIDPRFSKYVAEAFRLGIFRGAGDGYFYPTIPLTRAEVVVILHRAFVSPSQPLESPPNPTPAAAAYSPLEVGSTGRTVLMLERRLSQLGYVCGDVDGVYDRRTRDAVMAFEKFERLDRDGTAEPEVWARLFFAAETPAARLDLPGKRVEVDLSRQVMLLIVDGRVVAVVHVSTGKAGTPTGHGTIWLKQRGWVESSVGWMYYPCYFWPRIAIHGSSSVPPYPASHGCVRTPVWIAPEVFSWLQIGTRVDVYY